MLRKTGPSSRQPAIGNFAPIHASTTKSKGNAQNLIAGLQTRIHATAATALTRHLGVAKTPTTSPFVPPAFPKTGDSKATKTLLRDRNSHVSSLFESKHFTEIVTPVDTSRLASWLDGFPQQKRDYLLTGFTEGFRIAYQNTPSSMTHPNHKSARDNPEVLTNLIRKEIDHGRIGGPFLSPPFDPFLISPLGLVPKKESGTCRLIHDLSFPRGSSVNSGISDEDAAVTYESLDRVIALVHQMQPGALIGKVDIESAFRIVPIHPLDRHLLGFKVNEEFFFDKCLPMGCRSSCAIFESFSTALQWVALNKLHIPAISHILDDFIFVGPANSSIAENALETFCLLCRQCNIPIKESKTVRPSTRVTVHGIELDTVHMEARLPGEKIEKARVLLTSFINSQRVTLRSLQEMLGFLNFACRVIAPGRPFLRRLINLSIGVSNPHQWVNVSRDAKADAATWLNFLDSFNGISVFPEPHISDSDYLRLYSDASGSLGCAGVFGPKWFAEKWPTPLRDASITVKEMLPITLIVEIWGEYLSNKRVLFHTDNESVAAIINKQTSRDPATMNLLRRLVVASLNFNIIFRAKHIPGFSNIIADYLSRFQLQAARSRAPWLEPHPTTVPPHLISAISTT